MRMTNPAWIVAVAMLLLAGCARTPRPRVAGQGAPGAAVSGLDALVPAPALVERGPGAGFTLGPGTAIRIDSTDPAVNRIAGMLADWCRRATGAAPTIVSSDNAPAGSAGIIELIDGSHLPASERALDASELGAEGYDLTIGERLITVKAPAAAGLFYGVQTLRQLLPYWSEYKAVMFQQPRPAVLPAAHIRDVPRYAWRGAMLDVARHFFPPDAVKRFIDLLALNKMNRLHLHLADDQGWRIEIHKWPGLTAIGGRTEVGGGPGGYYTQAQFADLVSYAAQRFVTIVPEIDMPGHINAALASYGELNCSGIAPPLYTGTDVGFSLICIHGDATYRFIDDIVAEIGGMSGSPYFHVGGDEVKTLGADDYRAFVGRVQEIVRAHGKQMIGWDETAAAQLAPDSIVQHWRPDAPQASLAAAPHLILSPGNRAYLDMKYDSSTALGLNWAGLIPLRVAYDWNPAAVVPAAPASAILGVEAPLWSETVVSMRDVEFLAMPRLAAIAEVAWTPEARRDWSAFRLRLGAQAPRWTAMGINFFHAPDVPWIPMP